MKIYATANISTKYQVTIPKVIRDFLTALKPGTQIGFELDKSKSQVVITPSRSLEDFVGILGKPPKNAGISLEETDKLLELGKSKYYSKKYGKSS